MTPPPVVSSPAWVRVDVAVPAPWHVTTQPGVVHLGHSALVLRVDRRQLVITSESFGLVPGGIQVAPPELSRLRQDLARGGAVSGWRPAVVEVADLTIRPVDIDPAALVLLEHAAVSPRPIGALDPSRQRADAPALSLAALRGTPLTGTLLRLIGAGPGSTPAGDDVVAGVLAGLRAAGRTAAAASLGSQVLPLLARTTSASAHYLAAAADGRFADRVHTLVAGLRDERSAAVAVRAAATFGASSGADLLAGVVAAARTALLAKPTRLTRKSA